MLLKNWYTKLLGNQLEVKVYVLNNNFIFSLSSLSFSFSISSIFRISFAQVAARDVSSCETRSKSALASFGFQAPAWALARRNKAFTLSGKKNLKNLFTLHIT